jgi:hypothetical protein
MTPDVRELIADRSVRLPDSRQLDLGGGLHACVGGWIVSIAGADLKVVTDDEFRRLYDEVDDRGRPLPPREDHAAVYEAFVRCVDDVIAAGLRLSCGDRPAFFRSRDAYVWGVGALIDDAKAKITAKLTSEPLPENGRPLSDAIDRLIGSGRRRKAPGDDVLAKVTAMCAEFSPGDLVAAIEVHRANCPGIGCPVLAAMEAAQREEAPT